MSDKIMCSKNLCRHFIEYDEGEDNDGCPYEPALFCNAAKRFLYGEDNQECVAVDQKEEGLPDCWFMRE